MGTLVVSPFYLSASLALSPLIVGVCLTVGPLVAALASAPAGRLVDRLGSPRLTLIGLVLLTGAATTLSLTRIEWGVIGYVAPLAVLTLGYALFQAANNTAVMQDAVEHVRGVTSGMLNLSRNLGLITGASVMGAIFAHSSAGVLKTGGPAAGALAGIHATYVAGAHLLLAALFAAAIAQSGGALRWTRVHQSLLKLCAKSMIRNGFGNRGKSAAMPSTSAYPEIRSTFDSGCFSRTSRARSAPDMPGIR
jgi:MFS family permease